MKLIIGGAYQGKRKYALENYQDQSIIEDFHIIVLELLKNDIEPVAHIKEQLINYKNKVIICDDISCGIVPMEPLMRKWRESLGHILAILAEESDEVVKVFCGIGMRLK